MTMTDPFGTPRVSLGALVLRQAAGVRVQRRQRRWAAENGANLHQSFHTVMRESPVLEFSTGDVFELLDLLDNEECPMWPLASGGAVATFPAGSPDGPGWRAGSTHVRATIATGHAYVDRLAWATGAALEASVSVLATSTDGLADPLAVVGNVAAPAQLDEGIAWVLDTMTLGGIAIRAASRVEYAIGHQASTEADACFDLSRPYPRLVMGAGPAGAIAIAATIEAYDLAPVSYPNATLVTTWKAKDSGSVGLGATTRTITLAGGLIDSSDRTGATPGTRSITILARATGATKPLTVA